MSLSKTKFFAWYWFNPGRQEIILDMTENIVDRDVKHQQKQTMTIGNHQRLMFSLYSK